MTLKESYVRFNLMVGGLKFYLIHLLASRLNESLILCFLFTIKKLTKYLTISEASELSIC